jgi:CrcB protein
MNLYWHALTKSLVPIGLFGLLGIFSRYFMGLGVNRLLPSSFPYGTFFINILGSFLIGVIYVAGIERMHLSPQLRLGITVGFLGGFTTFSSYSLESALLFEREKILYALCYFALSPMIGLLFTFCGILLTRKIF